MIRWLYVFKYPAGVPVEEGERWYLGTHTQEAKQMAAHGLVSYKTWKALKTPYGTGSRSPEELNQFERVTELVFPDWETWRRAVIESGIVYTKPPYGDHGFEAQTIFLGEEPEYDLLNEVPDLF